MKEKSTNINNIVFNSFELKNIISEMLKCEHLNELAFTWHIYKNRIKSYSKEIIAEMIMIKDFMKLCIEFGDLQPDLFTLQNNVNDFSKYYKK